MLLWDPLALLPLLVPLIGCYCLGIYIETDPDTIDNATYKGT